MPIYRYTALTSDGNVIEGKGEYDSLEDLYYSLQKDNLTLVKYSITKSTPQIRIYRRKIKRIEIAELLHNLSLMLKSGVPLITALQDLKREIKNVRLQNAVSQLLKNILQGESFYSSSQKTKIFPPIVLSLIQTGEASGTLDKTLEEASRHLYRVQTIISQTKKALIYPTFVLLAMSSALAFWIFFVLPKIFQVFRDMGIKLPLPTILLMQFISFMDSIKFYILIGIFLSIIFFTFLYKHPKTQIFIEKVILKIPIFGRVRKLYFLAYFFELFSLLMISGIDFLRLLRLLKGSFHRLYYKQIIKIIEEEILRGYTLSSSMKKIEIFSPLDIRMVFVGESTGRLDEQMKMLANHYFEEVQRIVDTLTKILEPLVLAIAGIIFLIIIIALIGPIYELISQLGKAS